MTNKKEDKKPIEEEVVEEPVVKEKEVEEKEVEEEVVEKGFAVNNANGEYVRTYTKELHGKDAEKLANQFAGKISGKVTKQK